ncbi:ribose 5-phosphate isomerase B [Candidatus Aerophobetes bacterium]|uniref:Ribose 5-phosphate isomerase B n=1 Tax=Aerophobetes bacterium TaxID=2030807 RepID=A0A523S0X6_UNCAE|nr:MAG: ribose 5-phosphate isomerase B [Candidatus Aerophobetes bacterium]
MKIALGADHGGYELKEEIKNFLEQKKVEFYDFGTYDTSLTDYADWGIKVAEKVAQGKFKRGILICGTGLGMCLTANKVPGIRATPCYGVFSARLSRKHNDSNILVLGGRITAKGLARQIVEEWLTTEFDGERHKRRLDKITKIEIKYSRR